MRLLVLFFWFGAAMCSLTVISLLSPGSFLEPMWRLNPDAHSSFNAMGNTAILLMAVVGISCALTSIGLARRVEWGRRLAISVLVVNMLGDLLNTRLRGDLRTLIGLPIAGTLLWYLFRHPFGDCRERSE